MHPTNRYAPGARRMRVTVACVTTFVLVVAGDLFAQCETSTGVQHRAFDGGSQDKLGSSVAVGGGVALLGAPGHPEFSDTGAVYILDASGGNWTMVGKVMAADAAAGHRFGSAVATDGQWALIGAEGASSAYLFRNEGGTWTQRQKLVGPESNSFFGFSVALSGNTAIVGAYGALSFSGKAYVYAFDGVSWNLAQTLTAPDAATFDFFGASVALSETFIAVGAYGEDTGGTNAGSVYVYRKIGGSWSYEQTLKPSDVGAGDSFGRTVVCSADLIVGGAPKHDSTGADAGAAYVYWFDGAQWVADAKLVGMDTAPGDKFGSSVSISGPVVVIGSPFWDDASGITDRGAGYTFSHNGTTWQEGPKLLAPSPFGWFDDALGNAVAVGEGVAVTAAQLADGPGRDAGHVYTFDMACNTATPDCTSHGDCNDNDVCTTDLCSNGTCTFSNNTASCDDGDPCTVNDVCGAGVCAGGPLNCSDGIACTLDRCEAGSCLHDAAACECATNADCNDGNSCTSDLCGGGACSHANIVASCDDGDACTTNDTCSVGVCRGTPQSCDDGIACTIDRCEAGSCLHDAAACECATNADCNDGNPCTSDLCGGGACSHANILASCDDGDACTENDVCSAGVCFGVPRDCDDGLTCTQDTCVAGTCVHDASACECVSNAECDDGLACSLDRCVAGSCQNDTSACECSIDKECSDNNACTADLCGFDRLCRHEAIALCCGNGICEKGEDACTCGVDCQEGTQAACGNGVCEAGDGEDCLTCPADCNGVQSGPLRSRFCCGGGFGSNPVSCEDNRCVDRTVGCTNESVSAPCCGDGVCESYESGCFCPQDCGLPLAFESPGEACRDGIDNDCDGLVDCVDSDCMKEATCWVCDNDGVCDPGEDCNSCPSDCDSMARGRRLQRFCCGNGVREAAERDPAVCDGNP